MATKLSHDLTYDAPLAEVARMLRDQSHREAVCDAQRALDRTVNVEEQGEGAHVVIDQTWSADGIPSPASKFVGDQIHLVQTEEWSDEAHGTVEVVIPGKPGQMTGTMTLTESGGVTTETVAMEVKVGIPLVGGKIEKLIGDLLVKALTTENRVGRTYLGD